MPDCDYCEAEFEDEQSYLEHLAASHEGELGTIDRRRVEAATETDGGDGFPTGPVVLGVVIGFAVLLIVYVIFFVGGGGGANGTVNGIEVAQTPGTVSQSQHAHGLINVTIAGERVDFSRPEYQRPREFRAFHFERGNGRMWHKHAGGVTLEYAMATLGIDVSETSVTIDGTTYRDGDPGTNVSITVNGQSVDPATYELQGASDRNPEEGDFVKIVVETGAGG